MGEGRRRGDLPHRKLSGHVVRSHSTHEWGSAQFGDAREPAGREVHRARGWPERRRDARPGPRRFIGRPVLLANLGAEPIRPLPDLDATGARHPVSRGAGDRPARTARHPGPADMNTHRGLIVVVLLFLGVRLLYPVLFVPPSYLIDPEDLVRGTLAHD